MATAMLTWEEVRKRVLKRDGFRCTVSRLLGGECRGNLHVHHIVPRAEGGTDEGDNLGTACSRHHPRWEALRRALIAAKVAGQDPRARARERSLRRVERWIRYSGVHFDRQGELEEELFGRWGRARGFATDDEVRAHLLSLWRQERAGRPRHLSKAA
jgi:hypothetical protein